MQAPDKTLSVHTIVYTMKTQKKRLTVSTCNFLRIANSLQIPVQNEHDAKCLRKHSTFAQFYMTTPWLYDENSQFYTKICDFWLLRTWFMAQDDSALKRTQKNWSVQHDAEKDVATIKKIANYLGASCFFTCWHSNTADGIGEPQSPRVYIYISTNITGAAHLVDG